MTIKDAATIIYGNMKKDPKDPPQIAAILIEILVQVIAELIVQYGPALIEKLKDMNFCDKITLRMSIRKKLKDTSYFRYSRDLYTSFLITAQIFTEEQIREIISSYKS